MRLTRVIAYDPQTKEKQVFTFGKAAEGKAVITRKGGRLNSYLEFLFGEADNLRDVEAEFVINGEEYSLGKVHGEDGAVKTLLKKKNEEGRWQVASRTKAIETVQELVGNRLQELMKDDFVSNKTVDGFHGNLLLFDQIRLLSEVENSVARSTEGAKNIQMTAVQTLSECAPSLQDVSSVPEDVEKINGALEVISRQIGDISANLARTKAMQSITVVREGILQDLEAAQAKYNKLKSREKEIEQLRADVKLRDDVETLIPKVRTLRTIVEQRAEYEEQSVAATAALEALESEYDVAKQQLDEKQGQMSDSQQKRGKIDSINADLALIASLREKNAELNDTLADLNEKQQNLIGEKAMYANKLEQVEQNINEVKQGLDEFQLPGKSVSELLESVRVDVKIDEVDAQVQKLQSEIAIKESQIAEKEGKLAVAGKRFRAVAELDVAVTPIKAKDTILQVLDAKYSKLETINTSLKEKLRNLQRALEDYKYRIAQLDASKSRLESEYDRLLMRKQEEFKREVYLNSQKVYSEDASAVFAVNANFHDGEIDAMQQEIATRNMDRDLLMERAYTLEGSIKEIKRHLDINSAEMETLQAEKDNINQRYNDIISQNNNEAMFNYLKALNSNNGTKYLLDVQQDAVRSEAELSELKRSAEAAKNKLASLTSRLRYLKESQAQLQDTSASVDTLVHTSDRLKDELSDIGERLSAGYEQYKAVSRQLENIESRLEDVRASVVEITKTIKVNEDQIDQATQRATQQAGSEDLEKAVADMNYELGDDETETDSLAQSVKEQEQQLFQKRMDKEKAQWLFNTRTEEYNELYKELSEEFRARGLDATRVAQMDIDANIEPLRAVVKDYDAQKAALSERIQNLYDVYVNQPDEVADERNVALFEQRIAALKERQQALMQLRKEQMDKYVTASDLRFRATVAATEARTIGSIQDTLMQSNVVAILVRDKVNILLESANKYLQTLAQGKYRLVHQNYSLVVVDGDQTVAYDQLDAELKTAVYLSLYFALSANDESKDRWLVFDERMAVDKQALASVIADMPNVSYVVDYERVKED